MEMINEFVAALGEARVLTGNRLEGRMTHVWKGEQMRAAAVLLPKTTAEVSAIMKICDRHGQPVVVHGGLTNLVGSAKAGERDVVISTEKMDQIIEIDPGNRTMTVQSGVILENVQNAAADAGMFFSMNFGAKGSARMGGLISTNAGGMRVFRYGMTRNLVLGLEAVMADGTVISSMKKLIKDNSGYDLKQFFIGSEGTLGIVTAAVLKLSEAPAGRCGALVGIRDFGQVVRFLKFMDRGLAGTLSAFELLWKGYYDAITSGEGGLKRRIAGDYPFFVLLDSLGADQDADLARLNELLEEALGQEIIEDAVVAQSTAELSELWRLREDVDILIDRCKHYQSFDISLPVPLIGETIGKITDELVKIPGVGPVFPFGHAADGNIHFILGKATTDDELTRRVNETVYGPLEAVGGSVSAEHGIGIHKRAYLKISRSPAEVALMRRLKQSLDPKGLLNPGLIFG